MQTWGRRASVSSCVSSITIYFQLYLSFVDFIKMSDAGFVENLFNVVLDL